MELQQTELDVRTREHYRHVDDANRNAWLRPAPAALNRGRSCGPSSVPSDSTSRRAPWWTGSLGRWESA